MDWLRSYALPIGLVVVAMMLYAASPLGLVLLMGLLAYALVRWRTGEPSLCDSCVYNDPDQCRRPERPHATSCVGYEKGRPPVPRGLVVPFRRRSGED